MLAALALATLSLVPAAGADPPHSYSASVSPTLVQPSTPGSYTITLTNESGSANAPDSGDITLPSGFTLASPAAMSASITVGACAGATWLASLDPFNSSKIELAAPPAGEELCQGGTLTVTFSAISAVDPGTYTWTTDLFAGPVDLDLVGGQPQTTVAGSPPPPSIDSRPNDPTNSTSADFAFSDSEDGIIFQCRLDAATFGSCASPQHYSGLTEGSHEFDVKAIDAAGGESSVTSYTWTIDAAPPPPPSIDARPPSLSNSKSASFSYSDAEGGVTFQCKLDSGSFVSCPGSGTSYSGLSEGAHSFAVKAIDPAGNSSSTASYGWTVDTVPPTIALDSTPTNPSNDPTPTFSFGANEATPGGFQCKLDASAFAACTSPKNFPTLVDGSHTFTVQASDAAGNTGSKNYTWTIDTQPPPAPSIDSRPADPTNSTSAGFSFSDTQAGVSFRCQLDGGGFSSCTSPKSYSGLADGSHTFDVKAVDPAGNDSGVASYRWTIDTVSTPTYFSLLPSGASGLPRSDSYCASAVVPNPWEPRPDNYPANSTAEPNPSAVPWSQESNSVSWTKWIAKRDKVTGAYTGTTTEIFQWAACKWGIDEDTLRAVAVQESGWHQYSRGDDCGGDRASFGIMQVKNKYCSGVLAHGGYPDTYNSTALNVDYYGARLRSCYDGDFYDGGPWLYGGQTVQQIAAAMGWDYVFWGCIGSWFSGSWYDSGAAIYITSVKQRLANRDWLKY